MNITTDPRLTVTVTEFTQILDPRVLVRQCRELGYPWLKIEYDGTLWRTTNGQLRRAAKRAGLTLSWSRKRRCWFVQT